MAHKEIKAYTIDDEHHARNVMKFVVNNYLEDVSIVGESNNLIDGIKEIKELKPDIVFLDIEMPTYSGLQFVKQYSDPIDFEIIFVTAYQQHAIEAIRLAAFDYILKPVNHEDLQKAIKRYRVSIQEKSSIENRMETLDNNLDDSKESKLVIKNHDGVSIINVTEIEYLEASGMYTVIYASNKVMASKPLKDFEEQLNNRFYRVHRTYLINLDKLRNPVKIQNGQIELISGKLIPISRYKKQELLEILVK